MDQDRKYKRAIEMELVEATTESTFTVKESLDYINKHFHKLGISNYAISQSKYEKLRQEYNDSKKISNSAMGQATVTIQSQVGNQRIKDTKIIDEIVLGLLFDFRTNIIRNETPDNHVANLDNTAQPKYFKKNHTIWKNADLIKKLLETKYKIIR